MDLIERYVAAVRHHLPRSADSDIVSEIADNLRSQAEEREQQLGRALNEDEQSALLRPHGHPWLMASRYIPQQHLVGPALYPYYRQALQIVVFWVVLPLTLVGGALAAINSDHPSQWIARMFGAAWNGAIYSVGMVTIVFAILDHERVRITALDNWNPAKLPKPGTGRAIPRSESVIGLVFMVLALAWWTELVDVPLVIDRFRGVPVQLSAAPIWSEVYWPVVLSLLAGIAISLIDMVRPFRTLAVSVADVAVNLFTLWVVATVLRGEQYIQLVAEPIYADRVRDAGNWINVSIYWTFVVIGVIVVADIIGEAWRVSRGAASNPAVTLV